MLFRHLRVFGLTIHSNATQFAGLAGRGAAFTRPRGPAQAIRSGQSGPATASSARYRLNPFHETIDYLLLAGLFERDRQLVAIDFHHVAVAEFLVEHAVLQRE